MLAVLLVLEAGVGCVWGQELYNSSGAFPAEVDRIYTRGLQFLVKTQNAAGCWNDRPYGGEPAVVGLVVVSMLAHGDDPNTGPYSGAIHRGLDYILKQMNPKTGYIGTSMYNHGFGTLALAEAYGVVDDPRLGLALKQAVSLIVQSQEQNPFHAWRYMPESKDADTTVTGAQMVALLAARNAGIPVPEKAIQNGLKFFAACQTPDGGVGYTAAAGPNSTRTAITCVVYALAKSKDAKVFQTAFDYFAKAPAEKQYAHYYLYYASQAFFHGSPEAWQNWNRENVKSLKLSQAPDGNWDGSFGPTFSTAGSLLSLALNYRYLPIYER
jgi:squalene cyclase